MKIKLMRLASSTFGGLATMDEDGCCDNVDVPKGLSSPMNRTFVRLHKTMAKITIGCKHRIV